MRNCNHENCFPHQPEPLVLPSEAFIQGNIPVLAGLDGLWWVNGGVASNDSTGHQFEVAADWVAGIGDVLADLEQVGQIRRSIGDKPRTHMDFTWIGSGLVWVQLMTTDAGETTGRAQLGIALPWDKPEEQRELLGHLQTPKSVMNPNGGPLSKFISEGWLEIWSQTNEIPFRPFCWMPTPNSRQVIDLRTLQWAAVHIALSACLHIASESP